MATLGARNDRELLGLGFGGRGNDGANTRGINRDRFSMNTCLPAAMAAAKCSGRKCGGVAKITMSTSAAKTFWKASNPEKVVSGVTKDRGSLTSFAAAD